MANFNATNNVAAVGSLTGLGSGVATFLAAPSSANLLSALTTKTGTGLNVFGTSPNFTTSITTGSSSFSVFDTNAITLTMAAGATTSAFGYSSTASSTTNLSTGAVGSGNTKTVNIATAGSAGSITNVNIGASNGDGTITVNNLLHTGGIYIEGIDNDASGTAVQITTLPHYGKFNLNGSLVSVKGIISDANYLIFLNQTGGSITLLENQITTGGALPIRTGYGVNVVVPAYGSFVLQTDAFEEYYALIGGSYNIPVANTAITLQTPRAIYGNNFDGSAALTQIIASTFGGTGNGFTKFTGAATSEKTYTLPNSNATILYNGGALGTPSGGTLTSCIGLPIGTGISGLGTGVATALAVNTGTSGCFVVNGGALGTPSSGVATNLTGTAASLTAGNATTLATARNINGISFNGSANITIPSLTTTEVTGTTQTIAVNNSYIANNASQVVFTLPVTSAVGSEFEIVYKGAGGWKINQNAGQQMRIATATTTSGTGGSFSSTAAGDAVKFKCVTADTLWVAISVIGSNIQGV